MKAETKSFYHSAVQKAVAHIVGHLDDALELGVLARGAALSPFHFHRVFRGMVGETPLELHRRLRMERAAARLLEADDAVTNVAFDAGYDTHESFTRAFRAAFGATPSEFRRTRLPRDPDCARPQQIQLAARSGIHFRKDGRVTDVIPFVIGEPLMIVEIKQMPMYRLATVHHVGPYDRISEAFERLAAIARPQGLFQHAGVAMIGVYHDDPETTPPDQLQSDAGIVIPDDIALPAGLGELRLAAGRYASTTHMGPYTGLGDTWARLMGQWIPQSGHRIGDGMSYDIYRNTPMDAQPHELRTEIYVPLA